MQLYGGIDRFLLQILVDGALNCGYDAGMARSLEGLVITTLIWTFLGNCDSRIAICCECYSSSVMLYSLSTQLQAFADTFARLNTVPFYHKQQTQLFSAAEPSTIANVIRPNKHPRFPTLANPPPPPCQAQGNRESEPTFLPQGSGLESRCSSDIGGYCVRPNFSG